VRPSPHGRSPARATALIVGGVLVGVAVLVVILSSLGGGGSSGTGATSSSTTTARSGPTHSKSSARRAASNTATAAASPAETSVAVLNGTETAGLAHKVSGNLHQSGYARATALNGRPPGTNQVTVVEYAHGHQAEAQGVARSLSVTRVQPLEAATASLAGSATVVVVVGADEASSTAGGGESSGGAATAVP
jgi:hypothetical protein